LWCRPAWPVSSAQVSKETYYSVKRDLTQCQKRPTTVSKETYYSAKRDLLQCQKRPTTVSKETCLASFFFIVLAPFSASFCIVGDSKTETQAQRLGLG
jgi:hypothetical protein